MGIVEILAAIAGLGIVGYALSRQGVIGSLFTNNNADNYQYNYNEYEPLADVFFGGERFPVNRLSISAQGIEFIKKAEGFRAFPYQDSGGVWTIGYGTTGGITGNSAPITTRQAEELLMRDIEWFHRDLVRLVEVPLKQNEYDALMSFIYNLGGANLANSTLLKKLNAGDYSGAANEFPRWVYAGGEKLAGLVARREEEKETFLV